MTGHLIASPGAAFVVGLPEPDGAMPAVNGREMESLPAALHSLFPALSTNMQEVQVPSHCTPNILLSELLWEQVYQPA